MSEREREHFEERMRVRSFFAVFSCGGGGWKLAGLTFSGGGLFLGTGHFESSEIDDRDHEQGRCDFGDHQARGCRAKLFEKLIETKPRRTANTNKCAFGEAFFLRLYWIVRPSRLGVSCRAGASPAALTEANLTIR